jgi:hypothetical protein
MEYIPAPVGRAILRLVAATGLQLDCDLFDGEMAEFAIFGVENLSGG